jgi:O-antigen ligase
VESSAKTPATPAVTALFNSRKKSARHHPLEIALLILIGAHLSFLPWALGAMHLWSQVASFVLSLAGFALALIPRTHTEDFSHDGRRYRYIPARRLIAFPAFWLGLALLLYVLVQALNPAWNYRHEGDTWWMDALPHVSWLPSGAIAPLAESNPWRMLLVWSSAWMLVCSLWIGLTRRASLRLLLVILTLNASVLAIIGIVQHTAGNGKILWFITPSTHYSVATFLYKNHAGAFFNLLLATAAATATWYYRSSERRLERASPAPIFALCAVALALIVALSFSRAATVLMLAFIGLCLVVGLLFLMRSPRRPSWLSVGLVAGAVALLGFISARQLNLGLAAEKFQQLFTTDRVASVELRQIAAQATREMAAGQPFTGWGAGCFRFLFPLYQQHHPEIYIPAWNLERMFYFEHAHNDYLEFLAELGFIGCAPLFALFTLWSLKLIRGRVWKNPAALLLVVGLLGLLAHCWIDFHLRCPAILVTAGALAVIAARWTDLEAKRRSR